MRRIPSASNCVVPALWRPPSIGFEYGHEKPVDRGHGGLVAVTLMACYGAAPMGNHPVNEPMPPSADQDGDGFPASGESGRIDCDDMVASIHPGADDPTGDGIDQNCDGVDGMAGTKQ